MVGDIHDPRISSTATRLGPRVDRLRDPVYRHRAAQLAIDACLVALAFYAAFRLRFLETAGGVPDRYREMLWGSIGFVVIGKLIVFSGFGLYEKWWRYFRLPDYFDVFKAVAVSSAIIAIALWLFQPLEDPIPRPVVVTDFLLTLVPFGGARLLVRMVVERPDRRRRGGVGERNVLVVGAGSGGQMVVREMQLNPNLGNRAIGYLDDEPRKRGMRLHGVKVLGSTHEVGEILDETRPDEVTI